MNELKRHKKSDKIKWAITGIAFVLVFVMIAGICMQLFAKDDKYKPSTWFTKTECEHTYGEDGICTKCGEEKPAETENEDTAGAVIGDVAEQGIQLMSARIAPTSYAAYGVPSNAETSFSLSARVLPADATDTRLSWTVGFKTPSSAWANGKNVSDYVTIQADSSPTANKTEAVMNIFGAFGEPIVLTVKSIADETKFATKQIDYAKRIASIDVFSGVPDTLSSACSVYSEEERMCTQYTGGTVLDIYDFTYTGELYFKLDFGGGYSLSAFNTGINNIANKYGKTFNYNGGYYYTSDDAVFSEMYTSHEDGKMYGLGESGWALSVSKNDVLYCADINYSFSSGMQAEVLHYLYETIAEGKQIYLELCFKYNYAIGFSNPNVDEDIYVDGMTTKRVLLTKEFFYIPVNSVAFDASGTFVV